MFYSLNLFKVDRSNAEVDEVALRSFRTNSLKALRCTEENQEMRSVYYHMGIVDYFRRNESSNSCTVPLLTSSQNSSEVSSANRFFKNFADIVDLKLSCYSEHDTLDPHDVIDIDYF